MNLRYPISHIFSRIAGNSGFSLMPVILIIAIITAMITAGIMLIAPMSQRAKNVESHKTIDGVVSALIGWSVTNNRIPDTSAATTGFAAALGSPVDAWSKPFIYIAADNLLNPSPSGICNRRTTNLRVTPVSDDIAFVVISGGDDYTINSTPNTSQAFNGTVAVASNDIVRWVTLEDIKMKAGCYGTTRGRLKILNNELPDSCIGSPYTATLFSDGGILPYGNWSASALPAGLVFNAAGGRITGTSTGPAQTFNITFSRSDGDNATVQKILTLKVKSCGP